MVTSALHRALAGLVLSGLALAGCTGGQDRLPSADFGGAAMGTRWNVSLVAPPDGLDMTALEAEVASLLEELEQSMSTYRADSELSRFNAAKSTAWIDTSAALCAAVAQAQAISRQTGGAFDVTVGPLVNLWGFGPEAVRPEPPDAAHIAVTMAAVGHDKLDADCERPALRKAVPNLYVDLSAFAKGIAVDQAAALLERRGIENFMVELGGEIRLAGVNADNGLWRIAIEQPLPEARAVQAIIGLSDAAVATSGDYRNYFEHGGKRYSHTLDPRSGRPVDHAAASVTVVADTAALADAMATALLVLGPTEGLRFADGHGLAAYFLVRAGNAIEGFGSERFAAAGYLL